MIALPTIVSSTLVYFQHRDLGDLIKSKSDNVIPLLKKLQWLPFLLTQQMLCPADPINECSHLLDYSPLCLFSSRHTDILLFLNCATELIGIQSSHLYWRLLIWPPSLLDTLGVLLSSWCKCREYPGSRLSGMKWYPQANACFRVLVILLLVNFPASNPPSFFCFTGTSFSLLSSQPFIKNIFYSAFLGGFFASHFATTQSLMNC